jgi:hypothetical protein
MVTRALKGLYTVQEDFCSPDALEPEPVNLLVHRQAGEFKRRKIYIGVYDLMHIVVM